VTRPLLPVAADVAGRLAGTPLLSMLDVDGTLAPIAPRPGDAAVPPDTRRLLAALATQPGVTVAFVSGRAAADVVRMAGVRGAWVVGNHGFEILRPDGTTDSGSSAARGAVEAALGEIADAAASMPGVLLEDKQWTASVHFRLAAEAVVPALRAAVRRAALAHGLRVLEGKKVLEIRPDEDISKGTAAVRLTQEVLGAGPGAVLYIGDDATDEDAFASLRANVPAAVTVRVMHGDRAPTAAEFSLDDTSAVVRFLDWLAAARGIAAGDAP